MVRDLPISVSSPATAEKLPKKKRNPDDAREFAPPYRHGQREWLPRNKFIPFAGKYSEDCFISVSLNKFLLCTHLHCRVATIKYHHRRILALSGWYYFCWQPRDSSNGKSIAGVYAGFLYRQSMRNQTEHPSQLSASRYVMLGKRIYSHVHTFSDLTCH